jgi:hypothetical protein
MPATIDAANFWAREHAMTKNEDRSKIAAFKALLKRDEDFVRTAAQGFVRAALEAEMVGGAVCLKRRTHRGPVHGERPGLLSISISAFNSLKR